MVLWYTDRIQMSLFKRTPKPTATIIYISASGGKREVAVPVGSSVMEGAVNNSVDGIVAECGGACMCATCHVYVDEACLDRLEPIAEDEEEMLNNTFAPRKSNSRLSCQIHVTEALDGLIVNTPEAQQ
jgi:2Fe-2S ferredoxin